MGRSSVALMLCESIPGIQLVILRHQMVPGDLGQDAGRGYGYAFGVSLDNGDLRDLNSRNGDRIV